MKRISIHVDNIDIELLEKQKLSLYQTIVNLDSQPYPDEEMVDDLQGILNLLDDICDMGKEDEDIMRCPGCGCLPGEGLTKDCNHPDGCGYSRGDNDPS
jgi:hypothetical protein